MLPRIAAASLCLVLLVACGGGKAAPKADDTPTAVVPPAGSSGGTADMVLTLELLGPKYAGFRLLQSAAYPNERVIRENRDPEKAERDLQRFGRVDGYLIAFGDPKGTVTTAANLHKDAAGAAGYQRTVGEDIRASVGKPAADKSVVTKADFFETGKIGEAAEGVVLTIQPATPAAVPGGLVYVTTIGFQRGSALGTVVISRNDALDQRDEAVRLAKAFDERIQSVLSRPK